MSKYGEYRHIDLPWLKEIPAHWDIWRNKNIFTEIKDEVGENSSQYTLLSLTLNGIIPRDVESGKGKFPEKFDKYKVVKPGNMAFCLFDIDETPRTVGLSSLDGMLTGAYTIMRVENINPRFAYYYYLSLDNAKAMRPLYSGLRKTINIGVFQGTKVPIPPIEEQDQIVSYLDWQVSKINKFIESTKKKIDLLREYRKATIDEGILYGFGANEKKESGIYWLEEIPRNWEVLPIKRICKVNASIAEKAKKQADDELVTFLPMENVTTNGEVDCSIKKPIKEVRSGYSSFARGDVVVAKITPCFENGKGACLDCLDTEIGYGTTEFINLRPSDKVLAKYLYLITMTQPFRKLGEKVMSGSAGQKRVPLEFIKNFALGIPSVKEQKQIIKNLEEKLHNIDNLIEKEKAKIDTVHELKNRLISDIVTGKLDVRNVEIPEYEYMEESSYLDEEIEVEEANEEM